MADRYGVYWAGAEKHTTGGREVERASRTQGRKVCGGEGAV
jgi:hypothetical protein